MLLSYRDGSLKIDALHQKKRYYVRSYHHKHVNSFTDNKINLEALKHFVGEKHYPLLMDAKVMFQIRSLEVTQTYNFHSHITKTQHCINKASVSSFCCGQFKLTFSNAKQLMYSHWRRKGLFIHLSNNLILLLPKR